MSNIQNAGPDDEISDADEDAEISDGAEDADEASNEDNAPSLAVGHIAGRSATDPKIVNH